jgi:hypothetical protein
MVSFGVIVADLMVRKRGIKDPLQRRRVEWAFDTGVVVLSGMIWTAQFVALTLRHFEFESDDWFWLVVPAMVLTSEMRSVLRGPRRTMEHS